MESQFQAEPESVKGRRIAFEIREVTQRLGSDAMTLDEVACRAATCKIVARFASQEAYNEAFRRLFVVNSNEDGDSVRLRTPGVDAPTMEVDSQGGYSVVMFMQMPEGDTVKW